MCCVLRNIDVRLNPPAGCACVTLVRCPAPLDSCRSKRLVDIMLVSYECIAFTDDCLGRVHSSQSQTRITHCSHPVRVVEHSSQYLRQSCAAQCGLGDDDSGTGVLHD